MQKNTKSQKNRTATHRPAASSSSNDNGKLLLAGLLGATAGVALGLLFAPSKGSELRSQISDGASDLADTIQERASDVISGLKEKVGSRSGSSFEDETSSTGSMGQHV